MWVCVSHVVCVLLSLSLPPTANQSNDLIAVGAVTSDDLFNLKHSVDSAVCLSFILSGVCVGV